MRAALVVLCAAAFFVSLFSCSRTEPKIAYGFIELVYYQSPEKPQERFSFFIIPDDDDGIENLEALYLYNDREQLRWLIKSDDWVSFTQDGTTWIGSRSIAISEDEILPRGQYRAVLINKGGEKSERNFSFDAPEESRFPFPSLEISESRYTVNSNWPENRLVCYDGEGNYVSTVNLDSLSGFVPDLNLPSSVRTAALWAEDALYFTSAFTDVTALN
ncbi:hypothetical protein AGMMS50293_18760 [Spirochaetia bacterium]|nr:hypothetical protein AGMMS50293_18760 [Spirochaetia bacterium]